jgi:uncharacterized protein YkwD
MILLLLLLGLCNLWVQGRSFSRRLVSMPSLKRSSLPVKLLATKQVLLPHTDIVGLLKASTTVQETGTAISSPIWTIMSDAGFQDDVMNPVRDMAIGLANFTKSFVTAELLISMHHQIQLEKKKAEEKAEVAKKKKSWNPLRRFFQKKKPMESFKPIVSDSESIFGDMAQECLNRHNYHRSLAGLDPLEWDQRLAVQAQEWSYINAAQHRIWHSHTHGQGENIYMMSGGAPSSATRAIESWMSEKSIYAHMGWPALSMSNYIHVGHFTQIMWPSTTRVGCGMAVNGGTTVWTCRKC